MVYAHYAHDELFHGFVDVGVSGFYHLHSDKTNDIMFFSFFFSWFPTTTRYAAQKTEDQMLERGGDLDGKGVGMPEHFADLLAGLRVFAAGSTGSTGSQDHSGSSHVLATQSLNLPGMQWSSQEAEEDAHVELAADAQFTAYDAACWFETALGTSSYRAEM